MDGNLYDLLMNEATYYGKNKNLLEMEKVISEIKTCFGYVSRVDKFTGMQGIKNLKKYNKCLRELEKLIKETFGFKEVVINRDIMDAFIVNPKGDSGPHTIFADTLLIFNYADLLSGKFDGTVECMDKYHDGVKFKKDSNVILIMQFDHSFFPDYGDSNDLTSGEILSIIIHEIGHNFYANRFNISLMHINSLIFNFWTILQLEVLAFLDKRIIHDTEYMNQSEIKEKLTDFFYNMDHINIQFNQFKNIYDDTKHTVKNAKYIFIYFAVIASAVDLFLNSLLNIVDILISRDMEVYSDQFVASYGYGPEFITGMSKIENIMSRPRIFRNKKDSRLVMNILYIAYDIISIPYLLLRFTTHPSVEDRYLNNYILLKDADMKDCPVLRKEYDNNIKCMEELIDAAKIINKNDNIVTILTKVKLYLKDSDWYKTYRKMMLKMGSKKNIDF